MNKFGKVSLFTAGIMYPAAALVGGLVAWNLKSGNRDNVDITAGLAYLRPILVTGFVLFGVLFATSLVSGVLALKKDQDKSIGKLALILLATIVIVSGGAAFANARLSAWHHLAGVWAPSAQPCPLDCSAR